MSLAERVDGDLVQALRDRDATRLATLRLLKSAAKNAEVAKRSALSDGEYQDVVRRQVKMRREAAEEYVRANRPEQAAQERAELSILEEYLPAQLSEGEIRDLVQRAIVETGSSGPSDFGKVMTHAMRAAGGRADGKQVNQMARALLTSQGG